MLYIIAFNVLMIVIVVGAIKRVLPIDFLTNLITGLHYTIGITVPPPDQVRRAAIVWIVSVVIIIDVLLALVRWVI
jgi:hypothetical protein